MVEPPKAKHREIYDHIRQAILSGDYPTGRRIPTESEWASRFDTSRVTVSRALRDLEQQGLLIRRRGAGTFVREPQTASGNLLGLITGATPGLFARITDIMVNSAQRHRFGLLLGKWPEGDVSTVLKYIDGLREQYKSQKVRGVLLAPMETSGQDMACNVQIAEMFDEAGIAVVLLDRDVVEHPQRSRFDLVGIDNFNAGFVLADYLVGLGHTRIGFITHVRSVSTVSARMAGYAHALRNRGIQAESDWIYQGDCADPDSIGRFIQSSRVSALVAVNDHEAARTMRCLATLGLRVPEDLAIVSIDDDQWATFLSVSLTTLRQPCAALAEAAVNMMAERLADPAMVSRELRFTCGLVVRRSCGAAGLAGRAGRPPAVAAEIA